MPAIRVLLIEDESDTIELYRAQLTKDGFDVVTATNADDGLAEVKRARPAIVLLDIMLPGKSGFEVLDTLKKDTATKDIPVLALTNLAEEVGFERAREQGAVGYIVKAERTPRQVSMIVKQILQETGKAIE